MGLESARVPSFSFPERAAIVGLTGCASRGAPALAEFASLAVAAGAVVVLRVTQERRAPDPARFLGRGKISQLSIACAEMAVTLVIVDHELSPVQLRNLEQELGCRVIDRTQLILDIFARRARTREGKLQVELAQLKYLLPRLVGAGTALSRLGGGIGTRGPGETKLETDRRRIRRRITALTREIEQVRRRRAQLRARRRKQELPTVALVGYTNAGKTTLFNLLTGDAAVTSDALFVTVNPLVRRAKLAARQAVLLSDTVGFLDRLPHALVAAFHATLEEVAESTLLLHVCDAASPLPDEHAAAVRRVLQEVDADRVPMLTVFNKCDVLGVAERERLARAHPEALRVSALAPESRDTVLDAVMAALALATRHVTLGFDRRKAGDRKRIAELYRWARVLRHDTHGDRVEIEAELSPRALSRIAPVPASNA